MHVPLVIAHRGDSSGAVENSAEAVRRAIAIPVDMIEIDIRKSRDDVLYVIHDKSTGRTADRNIDVEHAGAAELAGVKLKNGEPLPTLDHVLTIIDGTVGLNIEIKSEGAGPVLARRLLTQRHTGYVFISSFLEAEIDAVRRAMPDMPVSLIYDAFSLRHLPLYVEQGFHFLSVRKKSVTPELVAGCHARNVQVFVWTVDDEEEMKQFIVWGVEGIYTNRPAVLKSMIDQYRMSKT
jgi:glycerophosphoryl diester phosphodiesterase